MMSNYKHIYKLIHINHSTGTSLEITKENIVKIKTEFIFYIKKLHVIMNLIEIYVYIWKCNYDYIMYQRSKLGYIEDELQQNENISECLKVQK